ncbi:TPM domain-containing protein [Niabella hirudinis]|uniref:TPM domain-containing protein n=1 Tax=Niabella hirudinis TaxID=1285929 RepID=UPI003EB8AE48
MAFSLFNKHPKEVLTNAEKEQVIEAIRRAESRTSGEIRVYIESHNKYVDPVDRAAEVFFKLKMDNTTDRNAVLLYVAVKDRQLAIFGDEGIYQRTGEHYWNELVAKILAHFNRKHFATGISEYIHQIGEGLYHYFPFDRATDQNELPDDIVFGS